MQRKALFVGIDDYTQGIPALSCARNDANALLQYFLKHGYTANDVSILRNGKTGEILDKLKEQTKELLPETYSFSSLRDMAIRLKKQTVRLTATLLVLTIGPVG